ncbi:MAG: FmdB family transcriptional regulator [Ardenticatenaceae bacterium]|nr:FmdB family transcriptional regulator [Ardenticatenaceae bacterium]MCB9443023.1 FmdB family transcriptional regulator [Ardenticatenaceae bacterium]
MPIYSYRCNDCGYEFDQRQRMSDDPLTICPVCEGSIRRVVTSVGVVFKGSGFYVTDNRGTNSANSTTSSNGKSSDTTSDTEKTTQSNSSPATADAKTPAASTSPAS